MEKLMMEISPKRDRLFRWQLGGICFCWAVVAIANIGIEHARWYPDVTAGFSVASALCAAALAFRPSFDFAYRWGGVMAVGALTLRCVTIVSTEIRAEGNDYLFLAIVQLAINVLLGALYADWWLTDVKDWHILHRAMRR
jgi:hypothetical protein